MPLDAAKLFQFYAAEISYFSAKVRPALRYKGIPYQEIAPSLEAYRDVIVPRTGLAFIPVVITPEDEALQDSSFILDELERRIPAPALYPATPVQRVVAYLIEVYADEFGLLPAMHYRWSFPESEAKAREDFAAASGNREAGQRFADRMKGTLPALGICPESIPAIEAPTTSRRKTSCSVAECRSRIAPSWGRSTRTFTWMRFPGVFCARRRRRSARG